MAKRRWRAIAGGCVTTAMLALAGLEGSYVVPLDHEAIQYASRPLSDAVIHLQRKLDAKQTKLAFDPDKGYLPAVLQALDISPVSQVLVFSKTSFQAPRIAPRTPRAIYFNEQVSVGWVQGGDVLEIAAVDPQLGVVFYTLDQERSARPQLVRQDTCLQCHASGSTLGVPGLLVRSVFPQATGVPTFKAGSFITDHRSPFKERWGGWYVSGTHGSQVHMGNAVFSDSSNPVKLENEDSQNLTNLNRHFDTGAYLVPHSDLVALMVLEHQAHMTNLITRVGFETRMALHSEDVLRSALGPAEGHSDSTIRRVNAAAEELLEYLLFVKEAQLQEPVKGASEYATVFGRAALRDSQGRSLRDFDLQKRLFRYPCSYLLYSPAFDGLPTMVLDRVYRRLWEVLTEQDTSPKYATVSPADRTAILEIVRETKKGLPGYWAVQANGDGGAR